MCCGANRSPEGLANRRLSLSLTSLLQVFRGSQSVSRASGRSSSEDWGVVVTINVRQKYLLASYQPLLHQVINSMVHYAIPVLVFFAVGD